jgi:hypothetical protein
MIDTTPIFKKNAIRTEAWLASILGLHASDFPVRIRIQRPGRFKTESRVLARGKIKNRSHATECGNAGTNDERFFSRKQRAE